MGQQKAAELCRGFRNLEEVFIRYDFYAPKLSLYLQIVRSAPKLRKCTLHHLPESRMKYGLGPTSITELVLGFCELSQSLLKNILSHLPNLRKFVYWQHWIPSDHSRIVLPGALMAIIEEHAPNLQFLGLSWNDEEIGLLGCVDGVTEDMVAIKTLRRLKRLETIVIYEHGHNLYPSASTDVWFTFLPPSIRVVGINNPSGRWDLLALHYAKARGLPQFTKTVVRSPETQQRD
ncbi:hypothetical protein VHEMI03105 [[Torrubiella] hemipterigena]|uniref:F-box domain-containing protein n=1 Tax=[Torrubiella] hemipterigena TaxID=1531966 RepID=A0A0A1TCG3_9HYPO|nr:hypothetical protein VHEMI03105 [[Torrubiella] hemipterigena]